jgi:hypothetical protein
MNDYVSYTVIATGFEGSHQTFVEKGKSITSKPKEKEFFRGGFNFMGDNEVNTEDLEIPTIIRVKSPKSSVDKEEETPKTGFNFESSRYNWARDKGNKKEETNSDSEDSSSFLRMIMD